MGGILAEMELRLLKLATRKLLDKFGSLESAAALCRVKPTNLSQYQSFEHTAFMPVDVAMALERACGEPVLTSEVADLHSAVGFDKSARGARDEALDVPVAVGELLAFICEATTDQSPGGRRLTENEKRRYFDLRHRVGQELSELDAAVESDGTLFRRPKP